MCVCVCVCVHVCVCGTRVSSVIRDINRLERIQRQTLKVILPGLNYKEALETAGRPNTTATVTP